MKEGDPSKLKQENSDIKERNFLKWLERRLKKEEYVLVEQALNDCRIAHEGIKRDTGEDYYTHPLAVALIIINELNLLNYEAIIAAILHDTIEDEVSYWLGKARSDNDLDAAEVISVSDYIAQVYNQNISDTIFALSKLKLRNRRGEVIKLPIDTYISHLSGNQLAVLVKACDRLHNLRTMPVGDKDRRIRYIEDTEKYLLPLYEGAITKDGPYSKYIQILLDKTKVEISSLQSQR